MEDKVGITGAALYIGTGLAWLIYSLMFNPVPWAAVGLFNGAFG